MTKIPPKGLIRGGGTFDYLMGAHVVMDYLVALNHTGALFTAFYMMEHGSELANDAFVDLMITTPSTGCIHWVAEVDLGGDAEIEFWERGTAVTGGTAVGAFNRNRSSPLTALSAIKSNPALTGSTGTIITEHFSPGGAGPQAPGSEETLGRWELKPSTNYLTRLYNRSGNAQMGEIRFTWTEEPA